jgi:hypothetical protein
MSENPGNVIDQDQKVPLTHLNRLTAELSTASCPFFRPILLQKDFSHPDAQY